VALMAILLAGNFWLSAALLCAGVIVWLIAGQAAARFRRDARISGRRVEARLGMMKESLSSMTVSKAYLMERFSQTRFERHLSELSKSLWRKRRGDTFSQPTLVTIVGLAVALMLYLAGRVILSGELSFAALVLKCATMGFLVVAIGRLASAVARIRTATRASEEIMDFLDRRGDVAQTVDAEFLQPMTKKLELVDVSLRETGTGRMLLDKISLTVPIGQKLAILAPDPEESLSFAYLLTRFQDPTGGEVRIDGKNTRWVTFESIRTQVALIMQQSLTFSDTVANNIGCGEQSFTLPQIIEAAKVAHAHQFIQRLPYGYETTIGDMGHSLKPGEQFRIGLARAILRDPSILIIQEPTDPFDADSIVLIDDTINRIRANRTIIFLTRRDATLRLVDQIAVIQSGKLIVVGKHQDLLASSDLYRVLHLSHS
jgi:ATP-binding cassette, subfamily B, bacterial